ncbi:PHP domain protein [Thermodesulfobium narugense DSM 14796]|uniref:PHP domain protein n=1 Tax=Thermodesulfobium narugense DSM 14796 TaxID=747365 RepID=M1E771_9BACT|nr:PHP domain-containing protein [Thermodesulfobium narugense]AEE14330.1 PHP domain protein [Thermodesulfobium narugense DSM 14796]
MEKLKYKSNQRAADVARRLKDIIDFHQLIKINDVSNFYRAYDIVLKWNKESYTIVFGEENNLLPTNMKLKLRKMFAGLKIDEEVELNKINNFNKAFFKFCGSTLEEEILAKYSVFGPISFYKAFHSYKKFREILNYYLDESNFYDFYLFYFKSSKKPIGRAIRCYEKLRAIYPLLEPVGSLLRFDEMIYPVELLFKENSNFESSNLGSFKYLYKTNVYMLLYDKESQLEVKIYLPGENFIIQKWFLTGTLRHNEILTDLAKQKFESFKIFKNNFFINNNKITINCERDVYKKLGFNYVYPELRCGGRELFKNREELNIVNFNDIKSDLHVHTNYSDGTHSIEELVDFYMSKGFQYIVLTDHSVSLSQGRGLDIDTLIEKNELIDKLNKQVEKFKIFKGAEVDILEDGSLDYPDWVLENLDFVIASVHQNYDLDEDAMTFRFEKAIKNPYVHMIGHISGRLVGFLPIYNVDLQRLLRLASEYSTIIEINGNPARLDLDCASIKTYKNKFKNLYAVNTDLHNFRQYDIRFYCSVMTARKSYLKSCDIVNSLNLNEFESLIRDIRIRKLRKNNLLV